MKSFLQGKKSLADAPLRAHATLPVLQRLEGSAPAAHDHAPRVEVVKEGDKVVRLVVFCPCGERAEIDCIYPGLG